MGRSEVPHTIEGAGPKLARYAEIEARSQGSPVAAVLVDVDTERRELLVRIDPSTGDLVATLYGDGFEAIGRGAVLLTKLSPRTTTTEAVVALNGYDTDAARCRQLEATLSLSWTVGDTDQTAVDVAGTALVTDLDIGGLVRFQAVRSHPFNRLHLAFDNGQTATAPGDASVPTDGIPPDRVPTDRVPADRVPADRVPADRVPGSGFHVVAP